MLRFCSLVFRAFYASDPELRLILRANWIHEHLQLFSSHFAYKLCCIGYFYSLHCPLKLTELCWYYFDGFLICWLACGLVHCCLQWLHTFWHQKSSVVDLLKKREVALDETPITWSTAMLKIWWMVDIKFERRLKGIKSWVRMGLV